MHIPDSMLQGRICPVTATLSAAGIMSAAYFCIKAKNKPRALVFAGVTALIFAGQMINFPVSGGTSGHLLGGVLASSLLGTPFGVLAVALVVTIQSIVFSDGGLSVLGANILNMAVIGAGGGGLLLSFLRSVMKGKYSKYTAVAAASWISVTAASFAVSVELAVDGQIAFSTVFPAMVGVHALIGIGEAVITLALVSVMSGSDLTVKSTGKRPFFPAGAAVITALMFSPFASGFPDGLESIAQKYRFFHESAPAFVGPLSGYSFPNITNEMISTSLAGVLGVAAVFCTAWLLLKIIELAGSERKEA